jgi:hypothetical protein
VALGEFDELAHARVELALLWRCDDRRAPAAPDLEQPLVPKLPERAEDGVSVHLQHGGQVERGREPLARAGLSIRDRTVNLGRNLLVQIGRFVQTRVGIGDPRRRYAQATVELYDQRLRDHISPVLGGKQVGDVTADDLRPAQTERDGW